MGWESLFSSAFWGLADELTEPAVDGGPRIEEVDDSGPDVTVTLPAWYNMGLSEAEILKAASSGGFRSAVVNGDGTVTYAMSEARQNAKLAALKSAVAVRAQVFSDEFECSDDLSRFTIRVRESDLGPAHVLEAEQVYNVFSLGTEYQCMAGVTPDMNDVVVQFVDTDTRNVLDVASTSDFVELLSTVVATVPASFYPEEATDAEKVEFESREGAEQVVANADGSVTFTLTKAQQVSGMAGCRAAVDELIGHMLHGWRAVRSFRDVTYDEDMSEFSVRVERSRHSAKDRGAVMRLLEYGQLNQALGGVPVEENRVIVRFVDADTGELLDTVESRAA